MKTLLAGTALAIGLPSGPAHAGYTYGATTSCQYWVAALTGPNQGEARENGIAAISWWLGFAEASGFTGNPLALSSSLEDYCKLHPDVTIHDAAVAVLRRVQ